MSLRQLSCSAWLKLARNSQIMTRSHGMTCITCQYPDMDTLWMMQVSRLTHTNIQGVLSPLGKEENFQVTACYKSCGGLHHRQNPQIFVPERE